MRLVIAVLEQTRRTWARQSMSAPVTIAVVVPRSGGRDMPPDTDMGVCRTLSTVLNQPVQDRTEGNRSAARKAQGQVASDE